MKSTKIATNKQMKKFIKDRNKKMGIVVHTAPIKRGRGQGKLGGGLYPKVAPSNSTKSKV